MNITGGVLERLDYKNFYQERKQVQYDKKIPWSTFLLCALVVVLIIAVLLAIKYDNGGWLYLCALLVFVAVVVTFFIVAKDILQLNKTSREDHDQFREKYKKMEEIIQNHRKNGLEAINSLSSEVIQEKINTNEQISQENKSLEKLLEASKAKDKNIRRYEEHRDTFLLKKDGAPQLDAQALKQQLFRTFVLQWRLDELFARTDLHLNTYFGLLWMLWQLFVTRMHPRLISIEDDMLPIQGMLLNLKKKVIFGPEIKLSLENLGKQFGQYFLNSITGKKTAISYIFSPQKGQPFAKSYIIVSNNHGEFILMILTPGNELQIEKIIIIKFDGPEKSRLFYEYGPKNHLPGLFFFIKQGNIPELQQRFAMDINDMDNKNQLTLTLTDLMLIHKNEGKKLEIIAS